MRQGPMTIGLFLNHTGHHIASWRHPGAQSDANINIDHYLDIARLAEAARFDFLFFADTMATRQADVQALSRSAQYTAYFEPLTLLSALSVVTKHIGLISTATTSFYEPYHVARLFASLDHLSHGRAGWNIVTSSMDAEARNFSQPGLPPKAARYLRAREFVDVVKGLWDSWDDDAFVRDREAGRYFDPDKMHRLDHEGPLFTVRGPLNVPRPPQGHPVLVQAGSSDDGRDFAASFAEVAFTSELTLEGSAAYATDVRNRMQVLGRDPGQLRVLPGVNVTVAATDAEAHAKNDHLQTLIDPLAGREMLSTILGGADLRNCAFDEPLPELPMTDGLSMGTAQNVLALGRRENLTMRQLYERVVGSRGKLMLIGSPTTVVDEMERWFQGGAVDGFIIQSSVLPASLHDFVELVVPELRRRGLMRTEYTGTTLRENLGLKRPASRYQADAADVLRCDSLIVGGGSAGCVLAARLSEDPRHQVILLEAGPDHGMRGPAWPAALLDATDWTHADSWDLADKHTGDPLACGRLVGGSSAINAGGFNWPQRADFLGWPSDVSFETLLPFLQRVESDPDGPGDWHGRAGPMPVVRAREPLSPFFTAFAAATGQNWLPDINDPDCGTGLARRARNAPGRVRWNAAFAYLDPTRTRPNLRILASTTVHRLILQAHRVTGVTTQDGQTLQATRVILTAGAYHTPALMLRSGIGPAAELRAAGIAVAVDHRGVGKGLRDHPVLTLRWHMTDEAAAQASQSTAPPYQVVLRERSSLVGHAGFDLQIAPGGPVAGSFGWHVPMRVEVMRPCATGSVHLNPADPHGVPLIDCALLRHESDVRMMQEAIHLTRRITASPALQPILAAPFAGDGGLRTYHHPCGTCRMGQDPGSVVDQAGRVHGIAGLIVADAAILPNIPSVPPHMLVLAMAERVAQGLRTGDSC